ncbi:uncharacterized protein LOC143756715 isoform X2 [Siphateles boraxobius]|uniref:uncharacterized protein LOC143756715 isoform X2 n=1 Tax=Siphateles boraxobius TaxID=180520 RepID=UPI004063EBB3
MLIFGLMLLQTAACMEFNCRFGQSDSCYAALGHKLNLQMVDARNYKLNIVKRINNEANDPNCKVKNDIKSKTECDLFNNRTEVTFINGTLIINRVIRADSGNYTLKLEDSDGTETSAVLQVNVEAPIGSVEVSVICSSSGVKSVSCSSDGDQLIYSWTLNGDPLMDANTIIQLNETTDGDISCSVKNHVSHQQKNISVEHCPGTTIAAVTSPMTYTLTSSTQTSEHVITHYMLILGCVAVGLILLFITAYHFYKRKQLKSTPAPAGDTELVYAEVSHDKHNKKSGKKKSESLPVADVEYPAVGPQTKRKERKEEEVHYGEVRFTPNSSNTHQEPKEECVYSQVQTQRR